MRQYKVEGTGSTPETSNQATSPVRSPMSQSSDVTNDDRFLFKHRRKDQKKKPSFPNKGGGPSMLVYVQDTARKSNQKTYFQHYGFPPHAMPLPGYPLSSQPLPVPYGAQRFPHFYNSMLFPFPALATPPLPVSRPRSAPVQTPVADNMTARAVPPKRSDSFSYETVGQYVKGPHNTLPAPATHPFPNVPITSGPFPLTPPCYLPTPGLYSPLLSDTLVTNPLLSNQQMPPTAAPVSSVATQYTKSTGSARTEVKPSRPATGYTPPLNPVYPPASYPYGAMTYPPPGCSCELCCGVDQLSPMSIASTRSSSSNSSNDSGYCGESEVFYGNNQEKDTIGPNNRPIVFCNQNNPTFCLDPATMSQAWEMAQNPEKYEQRLQDEKRQIRKKIPCRNLSHNGVCQYGENCWFSH